MEGESMENKKLISRTLIVQTALSLIVTAGGITAEARAGNLAVRSSLETVFPDTPAKPDAKPVISLNAARRESESAQIVIYAPDKPRTFLSATAGPLRHSNGKHLIRAKQVTIHLVGYVDVKRSMGGSWPRIGLWPDPLLNQRKLVIPTGENRLLWVTVTVPPSAQVGDYVGSITVRMKDGLTEVPVRLHVWDFALPVLPTLKTILWQSCHYGYRKGIEADPTFWKRVYGLFGQYRLSCSIWMGGTPTAVKWYREADGTITMDASMLQAQVTEAVEQGFNTLEIGRGSRGLSKFRSWTPSRLPAKPSDDDGSRSNPQVIDRLTGKLLTGKEKVSLNFDFTKRFLSGMADFLEQRGWLDRAYVEIIDEPKRDRWADAVVREYRRVRGLEDRIKLLSTVQIHPQLQGALDIWCPHIMLYDEKIYRKVRQGISLYTPKSIPAKVTASSYKRGEVIRQHAVEDVYDGCDYTFWMSHAVGPGKPQWLRFDFERKTAIKGLTLSPYKERYRPYGMKIEISAADNEFRQIAYRRVAKDGWRFNFPSTEAKSVRLVFTQDAESLFRGREPPSKPSNVAFTEVDFHTSTPSPTPAPPDKVRPSEIWEYNVNATWPSSCVDAKPYEHRVLGFLLWDHRTTGYLNYGGAQWQLDDHLRRAMRFSARGRGFPPGPPLDREKTMVWPAEHNCGEYLAWPGKDGPVPSIRMARLRDGMDDHDYLKMVERMAPEHPLLKKIRASGGAAYRRSSRILRLRKQLAQLLQKAN